MATLNPTLAKEPKARRGGSGGGPIVRFPRGGGDGDGESYPNFGDQLRRYRLGLAIGLAAVVMLFVAFTSAYIVRQGLGQWDPATSRYISDWVPLQLPLGLLILNTLFLLASSYTMEKARRAALERAAVAPIAEMPGISVGMERRPWLAITVVLGFAFLIGQLLAWREMAERGFFLASTPSSSFFYLLTGMHALHLAAGILALLYAVTTTYFGERRFERQRLVVDVSAWYWHFMAMLWIYVFALLKFTS